MDKLNDIQTGFLMFQMADKLGLKLGAPLSATPASTTFIPVTFFVCKKQLQPVFLTS